MFEAFSSGDAGSFAGGDVVADGWVDVPPVVPDALDLVLEVDAMMAVFAADRLVRIAAMQAEAVADAARHGRVITEIVERSIRVELASALRVTEYAAEELLRMAEAVTTRYPEVLASLAGARMTERHARVLVELLDELEPVHRAEVVPQAVALAEAQPVGVVRRKLKSLIDTVRTATLEERHRAAAAKRRVAVQPVGDGMAWLSILMPSVEAHAAYRRVTGIAKQIIAHRRQSPDVADERTLDQVRADVSMDLLIDGHVDAHPTAARGVRAQVVVTVPVLSLLSDEEAVKADPPVVEGIGPIPVSRARELCGGAKKWMRVLTHPETGMVLSVGRKKYSPPESLQQLTKWRAGTCMGPGCGVPASRSQIDHTLDWALGGCTSLENNAPLCQGHHTVKHHGGWTVRQVPDTGGALEWISPLGRRYIVHPERRVPTFTLPPPGTRTPPDPPF
jgi:hypothetical protein